MGHWINVIRFGKSGNHRQRGMKSTGHFTTVLIVMRYWMDGEILLKQQGRGAEKTAASRRRITTSRVEHEPLNTVGKRR